MRFMAFKLEADEFSNRKHWPSLIKNKFSFVEIFFIHISLWKRVKKGFTAIVYQQFGRQQSRNLQL